MPITKFLKFMIIFSILLLTETFSFSQEDNLVIKGGIEAQTLTLQGGEAFPITPLKGMLYYKSDENKFYIFDGENWKEVEGEGEGSLVVATRIVAASNSLDKTRADYVCDGTDDQEEIQKAIDDLPAYGGSVYLLEGTYNISAPIKINKSNVTLMGAGAATVLNLATNDAIQASDLSRIVLSQLKIKYDGNTGCWCKNISYSLLEKLWLKGCKIEIIKSNFNTIAESFFTPTSSISVHLDIPLLLWDNNEGISSSSSYNIIHNNIFKTDLASGAISILNGSSNNTVIGNFIKGDSIFNDQGIKLDNQSSYNIIVGNRIVDVKKGVVSSNSSENNIFNSNIISGCSEEGIFTSQNAYRQIINFNSISGCNKGIELDVDFSLLVGNSLYNNQNKGISVIGKKNLISSNYIYASSGTGYGIFIDSTSDSNYLVGNFIGGNGYSGRLIDDQGQNTKYTDKLKITLEAGYAEFFFGPPFELDFTTDPKSYYRINPMVDPVTLTLSDGKCAGDLLILENIHPFNTLIIKDLGNVNLVSDRTLYFYDTLKLIWNGSKWLELRYVDNK